MIDGVYINSFIRSSLYHHTYIDKVVIIHPDACEISISTYTKGIYTLIRSLKITCDEYEFRTAVMRGGRRVINEMKKGKIKKYYIMKRSTEFPHDWYIFRDWSSFMSMPENYRMVITENKFDEVIVYHGLAKYNHSILLLKSEGYYRKSYIRRWLYGFFPVYARIYDNLFYFTYARDVPTFVGESLIYPIILITGRRWVLPAYMYLDDDKEVTAYVVPLNWNILSFLKQDSIPLCYGYKKIIRSNEESGMMEFNYLLTELSPEARKLKKKYGCYACFYARIKTAKEIMDSFGYTDVKFGDPNKRYLICVLESGFKLKVVKRPEYVGRRCKNFLLNPFFREDEALLYILSLE